MVARFLTVADAHLRGPDEPGFAALRQLLAVEGARAELVVLGGDLFEFFVGRQREALRRFGPLLEQLEELAAGREVVFVQGNHDFHLEGVLPGAVVVADAWSAETAAGPVLWLHGDTLAPSPGYRRLRRLLRSRPIRTAVERLPAGLVWRLATGWAHTSRSLQADPGPEPITRRLAAARARMGTHRWLVTGHFHHPGRWRLDAERTWLTLGAWGFGRWYLVGDAQGLVQRRWSAAS